jgi:hypothetical protein
MSVNLDILRVVDMGKVDRTPVVFTQVHWVVVVVMIMIGLVYLIRVVVLMEGLVVI